MSTNFKFLENLIIHGNKYDANMPRLVEPGSCSLHSVHGALSTSKNKSTWALDILLRSLYYCLLMHQHTEKIATITRSTKFRLQFCGTRWLEDLPVTQRAIDIWPCIVKCVVVTKKKPKSKIPTSKSFSQ